MPALAARTSRCFRWWSYACSIASLLAAAASLLIHFAGCISMLLVLPAIYLGHVARRQTGDIPAANTKRPGQLAMVALLAQIALLCHGLPRAQRLALVVVTDRNLAAIGRALHEYCDHFDDYPPGLRLLVEHGSRTQSQLMSVGDPDNGSVLSGSDSSFTYNPGAGNWISDARLLLAYEREPWTPVTGGWTDRNARTVLLGDGLVVHLEDQEFQRALEDDLRLREHLGWTTSH